jgi:myo-inositol 2-dehydrogenase/D-chiro-inositol 1-dehydrogenase
MKIGLIGYGAWGTHHADAIRETAGMELAGVCARSEESVAAAREKLRVPAMRDYGELLALPGLDAVDVVLPTHLHLGVAAAALRAGKHVLLEKPMALDPAQCQELIAAARTSGKTLYIGHEARLSTQWGQMRSLIEQGAIGRAQYATIDLWRRPYRLGSDGWRWDPRRVGSWVLEEPIHFFDLVCWWLREAGRPESVYARASRLPTTPEGLWDNMAAIFSFESGAHATVTQTLAAAEHHQTAKVVGDGGALLAFWDGEQDRTTHPVASLKLCRDGRLEEMAIGHEGTGEFFELRTELSHFLAVCRGETQPMITPAEAALAVSLCHAAEQSIRSRIPVACL